MNNVRKMLFLTVIIMLILACGLPMNSENLDDQVQTAIAETAEAEATFQDAVDQAVAATVIAMPPTPTLQPTVDPYLLTEEELAALIGTSVEEAAEASEEASTATAQAASDGVYTEEEIYETIYYVYDAEAAIAYAEELLYLYEDLYGLYASEALELLYLIEEDLEEMAALMYEIETLLSMGAQATTAALEQLNNTLANLQPKIEDVQSNIQEHREKFPIALAERENNLLNLAPTEVAVDRQGAILQIYAYVDSVKSAFEDRKITPDELGKIAQLSANAQAGINQSGGPLLKNFSGNIDGITRNLTRGEWPTAQSNLGGFEASLPSRPNR